MWILLFLMLVASSDLWNLSFLCHSKHSSFSQVQGGKAWGARPFFTLFKCPHLYPEPPSVPMVPCPEKGDIFLRDYIWRVDGWLQVCFSYENYCFAVVVSSVGSGMQSPSTEDRCRSPHNEPSWGGWAKNTLHLLTIKASVSVHTNPAFTQKRPLFVSFKHVWFRASLFINRM